MNNEWSFKILFQVKDRMLQPLSRNELVSSHTIYIWISTTEDELSPDDADSLKMIFCHQRKTWSNDIDTAMRIYHHQKQSITWPHWAYNYDILHVPPGKSTPWDGFEIDIGEIGIKVLINSNGNMKENHFPLIVIYTLSAEKLRIKASFTNTMCGM